VLCGLKLSLSRNKGILFLCVANSARSQMAEGIARSLASAGLRFYSAGSQPATLNPLAVKALAEIGIDISGHHSKAIATIPTSEIYTVITLCNEEVCPHFPGDVERIHWGLPDPAAVEGDEETKLQAFRQIRDELRRRISDLFEVR
jgi:thioredoxin type arsenate reductase